MKLLCSLTAALLASLLTAAEPPALPPPLDVTVIQRTVTVQLGEGFINVRSVPVVPTTVSPGTKIRIFAQAPGDTYGPVRWFKDQTELAATGTTLEIPSATFSDTGSYRARVRQADGRSHDTDQVSLFVTSLEGQRLRNVSVRAQLNATQPSFSSGFVVEPGPWSVLLLIRVVGPSLARFGVTDPVAAPQLRVFDQRGQLIAPAGFPATAVTVPTATTRVGAFSFLEGGADVAQLFLVPAGAYTAQASAPAGSSGTVLVEIYQVSPHESAQP